MKKILFINSIQKGSSKSLPVGILSLATLLKKNKYLVEIIDFESLFEKGMLEKKNSFQESIDTITHYILNENPAITCFYTMCDSYHITLLMAQKLKEKAPNIKIVFGGPQASLTSEESMKKFDFIDVINLGEGEKNIIELIDSLLENRNLYHINGIIYREENNLIRTEKSELITNLDELPYMDYSLIDMTNVDIISLDSGRGCPFGCTFCSTKTFWKRNFRIKSSERLINEIKYVKEHYNIIKFNFIHDLFTANRKQLLEFCDKLKKENLDIYWHCSSRVDTLDLEVIKSMKRTGLISIYLGIETGSKRMQRLVNKNLQLEKVYEIVKILKSHQISIDASFIYGLPDENREDLNDTLNMMLNLLALGVENIQAHLLTMLPGTEMFNRLKDELWISENFSDCCNDFGIKENINLILENKEIFPNFYEFEGKLRKSLFYFDIFSVYVVKVLFAIYYQTYKLVREFYRIDALSWFYDFKKINIEEINENSWKDLNNIDNTLKFINNYIINKNFNEYDNIIKDMYRFEKEFNYVLKIEDYNYERVSFFNYDIISIRKNNLSIDEIKEEPVKVSIRKHDINKILIASSKIFH